MVPTAPIVKKVKIENKSLQEILDAFGIEPQSEADVVRNAGGIIEKVCGYEVKYGQGNGRIEYFGGQKVDYYSHNSNVSKVGPCHFHYSGPGRLPVNAFDSEKYLEGK